MVSTEKYDLDVNVVEAAQERILHVYHEFDLPIVCFSGGKDSLALLLLVIETVRPLGKKPVVLFVDEEFVVESTHKFTKFIMYESEWASQITPLWACWQMESEIWIASQSVGAVQWGGPETRTGRPWLREIPPYALTDFEHLCDIYSIAIPLRRVFPACTIGLLMGIRADESLARLSGLNARARHGHEDIWLCGTPTGTLGIKHAKVIYDWKQKDVFKFLQLRNIMNPVYHELFLATGKLGRTAPLHGRKCNLEVYKKIDPDFCNRLAKSFPEVHAALQLNEQVKDSSTLQEEAIAKYGATWQGAANYIREEIAHQDPEVFARAKGWYYNIQRNARAGVNYPIDRVFRALVIREFDKGTWMPTYAGEDSRWRRKKSLNVRSTA